MLPAVAGTAYDSFHCNFLCTEQGQEMAKEGGHFCAKDFPDNYYSGAADHRAFRCIGRMEHAIPWPMAGRTAEADCRLAVQLRERRNREAQGHRTVAMEDEPRRRKLGTGRLVTNKPGYPNGMSAAARRHMGLVETTGTEAIPEAGKGTRRAIPAAVLQLSSRAVHQERAGNKHGPRRDNKPQGRLLR